METDPQTISAYLIYLSQHAPVEEQSAHNDLALVREPTLYVTLKGAGPSVRRGGGAFCVFPPNKFPQHPQLKLLKVRPS